LLEHNTNSTILQTAESFKTEVQTGTRRIKDITAEKTNEGRQWKRTHEQFPRSLHDKVVDNEQSYGQLKFGDNKGQRKSTTEAALNQGVSKNYFKIKY
jgi:hypothetical protein